MANMNNKNQVKNSFFDGLKRAILSVSTLILQSFDAVDVLFILGLCGFTYGVSQIVSIPAAFAASGVILMLLAVAMLFDRRGNPPKGDL